MRILIVAMPFSIHTARWISQLTDCDWDVHLFPSMQFQQLNENIKGITYHEEFYNNLYSRIEGNRYQSEHFSLFSFVSGNSGKKFFRKLAGLSGIEKSPADELAGIIKKVKPDIIHSLETQHSGYLTFKAKKKLKTAFPVWVHSTWGIDLHYFGQHQSHIHSIREMLANINLLIVEGNRDLRLARQFGYDGNITVFPSVGGGFHIKAQDLSRPSTRKKILIKGMHDDIRRGLTALAAIERCIDLLYDYELVLYSASKITVEESKAFLNRTGKEITILSQTDHETILALNAQARINICINLSDGLPNSMLEAMMMGAFPIQSNTSMAEEWLVHKETGMLVAPTDSSAIESAIREALCNDDMVDRAATVNPELIKARLDFNQVKQSAINMYSEIGKHNNVGKLP